MREEKEERVIEGTRKRVLWCYYYYFNANLRQELLDLPSARLQEQQGSCKHLCSAGPFGSCCHSLLLSFFLIFFLLFVNY